MSAPKDISCIEVENESEPGNIGTVEVLVHKIPFLFSITVLACVSACDEPKGPETLEASWICDVTDPSDYLVMMEAWDAPPGSSVRVTAEILMGVESLVTFSLSGDDYGHWSHYEWEDDIGCDCESRSMRIIFTAEDENGGTQVVELVNSGEVGEVNANFPT